jgi:L-malate glycosyltransferase
MPETLSIAHVDTELTFRGGQEALLQLALGLRERGHRQVILTPSGSVLSGKARNAGLSTASLAKFRIALDDFASRIVHAHSGRAVNIAWLRGIGKKAKIVATRHVAFEPRHGLIHRLKYTLLCDRLIAVSGAARDALVESGVSPERISVIPTGVRIPPLPTEAERNAARKRWGLEPHHFAVGHLGAFTREKGQDVAAQAVKLLGMADLKLILAGDGPLRSAIPRSENVQLPGHVEDRRTLLLALDLFVMPSRSEAWGLAALEAMASGVPVVASAVGGLKEIIEDGVSGWLVPADDPKALAEAIRTAREKITAFQSAARDRATRFSLDETVRQTEELYRSLTPAEPVEEAGPNEIY